MTEEEKKKKLEDFAEVELLLNDLVDRFGRVEIIAFLWHWLAEIVIMDEVERRG